MTSDFDLNNPEHVGDPDGEREIVELVFPTLRGFREDMAPRLAGDGMFVSTEKPLARGTQVRFRILLPEDFVLAEGDGVVAWQRTRSTHPDAEPGMGLRFGDVEEKSLDVIEHLVKFQEGHGVVFDWRKGAGEFRAFEKNEFAGSFIPASDIERLKDAPKPEPPATERPIPEPSAAAGVSVPAWVSEGAKQRESEARPEPAAEEAPDFSAPEPVVGVEEAFEVSLMSDDLGPDTTPLTEGAESATDLSVTMGETEEKPRRRRLLPLAGVGVVLLAVAGAVAWWMFFRPQGPSPQEVRLPAEAEPTAPAVMLVEEGEPEPEAETDPGPPETNDGAAIPAAEAPVASEEEPPPVVASEPATRVIDVRAERSGDATVVSIRGNGDFDDTRLQVSRLTGPSRVLVRISRIETYYRPSEVEVGSPEVARVRVGYHPEDSPPKLYVVVDLVDESMAIRETSVDGDTIRVVVGPA